MIMSKVERVAVIIVAVLMLLAAMAYAYTVQGVMSDHLTFMDLCWIYSPTILLTVYGIILLLCYKQRGIRISIARESSYSSSKYPWL